MSAFLHLLDTTPLGRPEPLTLPQRAIATSPEWASPRLGPEARTQGAWGRQVSWQRLGARLQLHAGDVRCQASGTAGNV